MIDKIAKVLPGGMGRLALFLLLLFSAGLPAVASAADRTEAQAIVDRAKATIEDLTADNNFSWLSSHIRDAHGVLIFPQVLKGGFFLGGSGGTGVLLVKDGGKGTWSDPAFYTLGSVTFGLQIGGEAAEVVMLAMNKKALDSLLTSSVKLGGDASIAVGPIGGGAKGAVTVPAVTADFVSFTKSKGLYAGLNLEGAVLAVRDALNTSYYDKVVGPRDIVIKRDVAYHGADALRAAMARLSAK